MGGELIVAAIGGFSDGEDVGQVGISTAQFYDPAISPTLVGGQFHPVISEDADLQWSEQVRAQPQGGTSAVNVAFISAINVEGDFDAWLDYTIAGFEWEIRRGYRDLPWTDWEVVMAAEGDRVEFYGRQQMDILLRDRFERIRRPLVTETFDETTPNERLINQLAPYLFGDVFQAPALMYDPRFLRVFVADNLAIVRQVQEGGNPTDGWIEVVQGYQLTASPTLAITAHVGGPPKPETEPVDLLADVSGIDAGGFGLWDSNGHPQPWTVEDSPPDAQISEDSNGDAVIASAPGTATGDDTVTADTVERYNIGITGAVVGIESGGGTVGVGSINEWPALIAADDDQYLRWSFGGSSMTSVGVRLSVFGEDFDSDALITGVEALFECEREQATGIVFDEVRLVLASGAVSDNLAGGQSVPTTKGEESFGASDNRWGLGDSLTGGAVNQDGFGIRFRFRSLTGGIYPAYARVYRVQLKFHTGEGAAPLRMYIDLTLVPGNNYLMGFLHAGGESDDVTVRFAGVEAVGDPIPDLQQIKNQSGTVEEIEAVADATRDSPFTQNRLTLEGDGYQESEFQAGGPILGIEFFSASGQSGDQLLQRISCIDLNIVVNRFAGLNRYVLEDLLEFDPAAIDVDSLELVEEQTAAPVLGWMIRNQRTAEQLLTLFAHSSNAISWGGIDGVFRAFLFQVPRQPSYSDYLVIDENRNAGPAEFMPDRGEAMVDRVKAARNWEPVRADNAAGITETFTEQDRQDVVADWRITAKADFDNLDDRWPMAPVELTITAVDPSSGVEGGDTNVTISGTGFLAGISVSFGGNAGTGVTVVDSETLTCVSPAGTGTVDVVLTQGEDSATLENAFEYVPAYTGTGTEMDPYIIYAGSALDLIRTDSDAYFELGADIVVPEENWEQAGFTGHFDGKGHTIDLTAVTLIGPSASLFGSITGGGIVENVGLLNGYLDATIDGGSNYKGMFCRTLAGTLRNCYAEGGTVETGGGRTGGLIGITATGSVMEKCYFAGSDDGGGGARVGAIMGFDNGGIQDTGYFDDDRWLAAHGSNATAKTTAEMKQEATFVGWDFTNVWQIDEGNDYPRHRT